MTASKLTWHRDGDGVVEAVSARTAYLPSTDARYTIEYDSGLRHGGPDTEPAYQLTYDLGESEDGDHFEYDLGRHPSRRAAKKAADRYERTGVLPSGPDPWAPIQHALVTDALTAVWDQPGTTPADAARAVLTALAHSDHLKA